MQATKKPLEKQLFGDVVAANGAHKSRPELAVVKPHPASIDAVAFLTALDADGWHNLVALDPSRDHGAPVDARTFAPGQFEAIAKWIDERDGRFNLYFTANEPKPSSLHKKLSKDDISAIRAIYADIDLPAGANVDEGLRDLQTPLTGLERGLAPPSFRVDSGGGVQLIWKLDLKYPAEQFREWAEDQGRAVANLVEGDHVQNIDRLLRLPGTMNLPTPAKIAKGRVQRRSGLLASHSDRAYSNDRLAAAFPPISAPASTADITGEVAAASAAIDMSEVESCDRYDDLPAELRQRFQSVLERTPKLSALWSGDASALLGPDQTSSAWRAALVARLSSIEGFAPQHYANLVWVWDQADRAKIDHRQLARDWAKYGAPNVAKRDAALAHFKQVEEAPSPADAWIDPTQWEGKPIPPRLWEVDGWIPRYEVTLLYGDGGVGKSLLAHQYATAAATGQSWLGQKTRPGRVMCFFCEDSAEELQRRQADINGVLHVTHADLGNLRLQSRKHSDNALGHGCQPKSVGMLCGDDARAREVSMSDLTAVELENARLQDLLRQAGVDSETSVVAARLQSILIGELHHRVKNTLAIVSAIVSQSLRTADDLDGATTSITHRLQALGTAHDLLLREGWSTAGLRSLVCTAIEAFQTGGVTRFDLDGRNVSVSSGAALAISMVLHELCTNAIKYGALSVPEGRVKIGWSVDDATGRFHLSWSESGGPLVIAPRKPSFGSRLIERSLPGQLAGEARLRFEPTGVICDVNIPLSSLREISPDRS